MEELKITEEIAIRTILFDACKIPAVGVLVSSFSQIELIWAEKIITKAEAKSLKVPLWTLSGAGSGVGSGVGYGDGAGDGAGSGDGDGAGVGYGHGYVDGAGAGDGAGDGDGAGHGDYGDYGYAYADGDGGGKDIAELIFKVAL
jgi:hypothetical protein